MIKKIAVLAILSSLGMTGCASTADYGCKMPNACAPVHNNYQKATKDKSWGGWTVDGSSVDEKGNPVKPEENTDKKAAKQKVNMTLVPKPFVATGEPVYVPPTPWRVWLSPTPAGDGSIASGSYVWFVTPGHWHYLGNDWPSNTLGVNTQVAGESFDGGTDMLHPIKPSQLGFVPGKSTHRKGVLEDMVQPEGN